MSHMHIPDGILSPLIWISGYVVTIIILAFIFTTLNKQPQTAKKIPLVAIMSALMLITMSVPLGILPVHISLGVLVGIVLGPKLGFISVFVVNLILAFIGHGGITVVGLNTLIIGMEVVIGFYAFQLLKKYIRPSFSAFIATFLAILFSLSLMTGILITSFELPQAITQGVDIHHDHDHEHAANDHHDDHSPTHEESAFEDVSYLGLTRLVALILIFLLGITLEAFVTALILGFILKTRPDMIGKPL